MFDIINNLDDQSIKNKTYKSLWYPLQIRYEDQTKIIYIDRLKLLDMNYEYWSRTLFPIEYGFDSDIYLECDNKDHFDHIYNALYFVHEYNESSISYLKNRFNVEKLAYIYYYLDRWGIQFNKQFLSLLSFLDNPINVSRYFDIILAIIGLKTINLNEYNDIVKSWLYSQDWIEINLDKEDQYLIIADIFKNNENAIKTWLQHNHLPTEKKKDIFNKLQELGFLKEYNKISHEGLLERDLSQYKLSNLILTTSSDNYTTIGDLFTDDSLDLTSSYIVSNICINGVSINISNNRNVPVICGYCNNHLNCQSCGRYLGI